MNVAVQRRHMSHNMYTRHQVHLYTGTRLLPYLVPWLRSLPPHSKGRCGHPCFPSLAMNTRIIRINSVVLLLTLDFVAGSFFLCRAVCTCTKYFEVHFFAHRPPFAVQRRHMSHNMYTRHQVHLYTGTRLLPYLVPWLRSLPPHSKGRCGHPCFPSLAMNTRIIRINSVVLLLTLDFVAGSFFL